MDVLRVWPLICEFGIGAILFGIGIWCGIRSKYLDLNHPEDKRLLWILIGGFLLLLIGYSLFTFWAPYWGTGGIG